MKASSSLNLAGYLSAAAEQRPHALAVALARRRPWGDLFYERKSFQELAEETDCYAHGFRRLGIERGWRVLLMAPPGIEFIASAFAIFKLGAILILIDPSMGKKNLLQCIQQVEPQAMVTVPLLQALKFFYPAYFATVRCSVTLGPRWLWGGAAVAKFGSERAEPFSPEPVGADDPAAIFFTTGSTGLAKGALYLNRMLHAQVRAIKEHLAITQDDVGMPAFAPFVLFSLAMGTCAVLPSMAPTKPARADPRKILDAIERFGVTYSFGSPAFWKGVGRPFEKYKKLGAKDIYRPMEVEITLYFGRRTEVDRLRFDEWLFRIDPTQAEKRALFQLNSALSIPHDSKLLTIR